MLAAWLLDWRSALLSVVSRDLFLCLITSTVALTMAATTRMLPLMMMPSRAASDSGPPELGIGVEEGDDEGGVVTDGATIGMSRHIKVMSFSRSQPRKGFLLHMTTT